MKTIKELISPAEQAVQIDRKKAAASFLLAGILHLESRIKDLEQSLFGSVQAPAAVAAPAPAPDPAPAVVPPPVAPVVVTPPAAAAAAATPAPVANQASVVAGGTPAATPASLDSSIV